MKKTIASLSLVVLLTIGIFMGYFSVQPAAVPASAAQDTAYQQILSDITTMTVVPHSTGSKENEKVQEFLVERISAAGITPIIQPFPINVDELLAKQTERYENGSDAYRKRVENSVKELGFSTPKEFFLNKIGGSEGETLHSNNILAKIDSPNSEEAILFVAHYDSVNTAPGAADDALATATMLNLLEKLSKEESLPNDFYFLFTDGEELGLLGAHYFVENSPEYLADVKMLFNFEARGNAGALVMFETSANNYDMVRHFAQSTAHPVSFSLATAVYDQMPNGTDFTEFKNVGYKGLNFAIIDGSDAYHRPADNINELSRPSAYHYYQSVYSMADYFINSELSSIQHTQDAVFFPFSAAGLIVIPGWAARILGFIPLVMYLGILFFMAKKQKAGKAALLKKALVLLPLGLLPALVTVLFFAASYLFFLPAILFLALEIILLFIKKQAPWIYFSTLAICLLTACFLYAPIVYLIHIALGIWAVTIGFALLPLIPAVLYSARVINTVFPSSKATAKA